MTDQKKVYITLDLEQDHAGYLKEQYKLWSEKNIQSLLSFLSENDIKLSIFIVAKSLQKQPGKVKLFLRGDHEFYLHSYSHNIKKADTLSEIKKGEKAFKKYFGHYPIGYRTPVGLITKNGFKVLKSQGFKFDSSVIPSFWPKPEYFRKPQSKYKESNGITEIPFSVVSPLHFVISLSWIKLFGWRFYKFLFKYFKLPQNIMFQFHLHDLWNVKEQNKLTFSWKLKYLNNKDNGFYLFKEFIDYMKLNGYKFSKISDMDLN